MAQRILDQIRVSKRAVWALRTSYLRHNSPPGNLPPKGPRSGLVLGDCVQYPDNFRIMALFHEAIAKLNELLSYELHHWRLPVREDFLEFVAQLCGFAWRDGCDICDATLQLSNVFVDFVGSNLVCSEFVNPGA